MASRKVACDRWHGLVRSIIQHALDKNNAAKQLREAFNSCILPARIKPVLAMLERIRIGRSFMVDLKASACSCNSWDISGIPCPHACYAINWSNGNPEEYVHNWLKPAYVRTYKYVISPMASQDQWPKTGLPPLMPPLYYKQPGRPRNSRKKAHDEPKKNHNPHKLPRYHTTLHYNNCGAEGHNRLKCNEPLRTTSTVKTKKKQTPPKLDVRKLRPNGGPNRVQSEAGPS
ncbi:uncharacterized protein Pyn_00892 [Prunus yedoensis var. nudiflora]|uniref:SWIM-type domain-containing protein n=1 Tax=Prunus yedoensis var. nudiflora TaxID=2094558 RepID=A0A314ZFK0_PRUYE|nr:uncharacterized protein Pyn_00892 [Prunus yedoensis var. nudiflora]